MRLTRLIVAAVVGAVYSAALIVRGHHSFLRFNATDTEFEIWLIGSSIVAGLSLAAIVLLATRTSWRSIGTAIVWSSIGFAISRINHGIRNSSVGDRIVSEGWVAIPIVWCLSVLVRWYIHNRPRMIAAFEAEARMSDLP